MPNLNTLLSQAFNGLALGSLLALVASGLTIVLGTLGVLNFAHGALFMLGSYAAFALIGAGIPFVPAVGIACIAATVSRPEAFAFAGPIAATAFR